MTQDAFGQESTETKLKKLLFDKRVIDSLNHAAIHYRLTKDRVKAALYSDLARKINEVKVKLKWKG